jgi:hypothetical protein
MIGGTDIIGLIPGRTDIIGLIPGRAGTPGRGPRLVRVRDLILVTISLCGRPYFMVPPLAPTEWRHPAQFHRILRDPRAWDDMRPTLREPNMKWFFTPPAESDPPPDHDDHQPSGLIGLPAALLWHIGRDDQDRGDPG